MVSLDAKIIHWLIERNFRDGSRRSEYLFSIHVSEKHLRSLDLVWNVDISIDRSTELMRQLIFLQFSWTDLIQIILAHRLCSS